MSLFGGGVSAAVGLRARLLDRVGAEDAWVRTSGEGGLVGWMSGPVATFFTVRPGAGHTPDLAELRVFTPVAAVGGQEAADRECDRLNRVATTSRWVIRGDGFGGDFLAATCAFMVGPHNVDALEGFALWCVREQIASATAVVADGIAAWVGAGADASDGRFPGADDATGAGASPGGVAAPYGWGPYPGLAVRGDEHEVVRHYEQCVEPGRDFSAVPLAQALLEAFGLLRDEMAGEGRGVWGAWKGARVLTCETPLSWDRYPGDLIARTGGDSPPTAIVDASLDDHPAGNGLRISLRVPWAAAPQALGSVAMMNVLDQEVAGATHTIGGWSLEERAARDEEPAAPGGGTAAGYVYSVYLPAALADPALAGPGLDLPAVMREVLLTLARQALLFRRMLSPDLRAWEDGRPCVGLAAGAGEGPWHGLAWGETGEGGNPGAALLDRLYAGCVGEDADWADTRPDGFTWWPHQQAQHITIAAKDPASRYSRTALRIATAVREAVPITPEALAVIAAVNAELGRSVLRLDADGCLWLACHLAVDGEGPWLGRWAHALAVDQYCTARDLMARLGGPVPLGEPAISAHPFSGPRPDAGELFSVREAVYVPLAERTRPALTTVVALLAAAGQGFPPHRVTVRDDGGVDIAWRPSQGDTEVRADPAAEVSVWPGDTGAGPGWIVRSHLPVTGGLAAKARWCNDRNAHLLDAPEMTKLHVTGGWGLSPEGECCLTTWLSPFTATAESGQLRTCLRSGSHSARSVEVSRPSGSNGSR